MSESEQDVILGRTHREYREAKRELAALCAEAESLGYQLVAVGEKLRTEHSFADSFTTGGTRMELPNRDRLLKLSEEIKTATSNKERLGRLLVDFGFKPQD